MPGIRFVVSDQPGRGIARIVSPTQEDRRGNRPVSDYPQVGTINWEDRKEEKK